MYHLPLLLNPQTGDNLCTIFFWLKRCFILRGFLWDCALNPKPGMELDPNEPIYIIELGSGCGKFGSFMLKVRIYMCVCVFITRAVFVLSVLFNATDVRYASPWQPGIGRVRVGVANAICQCKCIFWLILLEATAETIKRGQIRIFHTSLYVNNGGKDLACKNTARDHMF